MLLKHFRISTDFKNLSVSWGYRNIKSSTGTTTGVITSVPTPPAILRLRLRPAPEPESNSTTKSQRDSKP